MRFPKLILTVCAVGAGSFVLLAQNSDQETYDKALRALRQQVAVSEGRSGSTGAPSGTLETEKERQARQALEALRGGTAPRALAAEPTSTGLTAQQRLDAEKERQARQSLYGNPTQVAAAGSLDAEKEAKARQALERLNRGGIDQRALAVTPAPTTRPAPAAAPAPAARPAPAATPAPAIAQQPARLPVATTYASLAPELEAKARTVLSGLIVAELGGADMTQMASTESVDAAPEAVARPAGPMTRREKLAALLEEYKLDVITPRQYQERRAEILASN